MQDRAYVIAIVVVLAICCLGGLVAVTGYMNSNVDSIVPFVGNPIVTPMVIAVNTDTPAPIATRSALSSSASLPAAAPSPLGAIQTIAAASTPTSTVSIPAPSSASVSSKASSAGVLATATATPISCVGFAFCPQGGPPDSGLAPTGIECPRGYIWGRVADVSGKGIPNMRVRYQGPSGEYEAVTTKNSPDPVGSYNISVPPGSTWTIWLIDANGNDLTPHINVVTAAASGAGNCSTRRDFVQQK